MAYSTVPKAKKDGQIVFNDATTPTAITLQVAYEEGNFTFDKPVRDEIVVRDRGVITTVRQGDEQPITGSFNFYMREFTDTTNAGSLQDFINGTGNYASNASTGSGGNVYVEHYAVDMVYTVEGNDFGDDADHTATFSKCVCVLSFAEGDPNAFTLNFTCYGGVTFSGPGT
jgi:hypothetical protein